MADIIEFKPKKTVYHLRFKSPAVLRMNKTSDCDIALVIERQDHTHGIGEAWVPASSERQAKEKLHKMISVDEWID